MKLLTSKKFKLPQVFFISDKTELKDIPIGVPFIYGDVESEEYVIRLLEFELLYQAALRTGYPFNFRKILEDNGYELTHYYFNDSIYMEYSSTGLYTDETELETFSKLHPDDCDFQNFVKDCSAYVDISTLKNLNVFPLWLDKIEDAISTNIHNFAVYNNNMYNKKLEGMYGAIEFTSPNRNLIIIDISSSIPKAVSTTCLALAKNLVENFYADLIVTGTISTLYQYEEMHKLDITKVYENGGNNDQAYFKKLVSSEKRHYKTAIVFGDNDSPCNSWATGDKTISIEDGKKINQWEVDKLISLHTKGVQHLAAYGSWFEPKETERIKDWVKYLA